MLRTVHKALKNKGSGTTDKGLERAREILDTAGELFSSRGYAGLSMRAVAARIGVSLSVVQHYYKSKDEMLEALLLYIMDSFQEAIDRVVSSMAGATRIDQFRATMDTLLEVAQDSNKTGSLMEIWALANRHPFAAKLLEKIQDREQKTILKLIRGLAPGLTDKQCRVRAIILVAQLEGLTLYLARNRPSRPELGSLAEAARGFFLKVATEP